MKESSATQLPRMSVLSREERLYINFILRDVGGFTAQMMYMSTQGISQIKDSHGISEIKESHGISEIKIVFNRIYN